MHLNTSWPPIFVYLDEHGTLNDTVTATAITRVSRMAKRPSASVCSHLRKVSTQRTVYLSLPTRRILKHEARSGLAARKKHLSGAQFSLTPTSTKEVTPNMAINRQIRHLSLEHSGGSNEMLMPLRQPCPRSLVRRIWVSRKRYGPEVAYRSFRGQNTCIPPFLALAAKVARISIGQSGLERNHNHNHTSRPL